MNEKFNPFGLLILAAAVAAAFTPIQEALDEQGMALYLPSFGDHPDDGTGEYWAAVGAPSVATAPAAPLPAAAPPPPAAASPLLPPPAVVPPISGLGKLPPAPISQTPTPIAQGGPAAPVAPTATAETWHISRASLDKLLQVAGGMTADGCLKTPVIVEGMTGYSRVEAVPDWQPGLLLVFAIEPTQGAIECVEFAFDRSSPQW